MGGQLEYFGLWIDAEYGKARCAPSCSSYQSPQLSEKEYFHYDHLEVWAVGEEPESEDEDGVRYIICYSCNNITTTLIQISRLFYFGFFSKTNQMMI